MSVRDRVKAIEQNVKEKQPSNTMTQQQLSIDETNQNQQQVNKSDEILIQLDRVLLENEQVVKKIEGSITKQNEKKLQQQNSQEDENNQKDEEIDVNESIIKQVNQSEMDSENRILVGMVANELSTQISKSHRQSMDMQAIYQTERTQSVLKSRIIFNECFEPIAVGDDQFYLEKIDKIIFIQRTYKEKYRKAKNEKIEKMNRYRINVINELFETEKKYVADLDLLKNIIERLGTKSESQEQDIRKIFNLESIYKFNSAFLEELQKSNFKNNSQEIVMGKIKPLLNGFIFYYEYCKEYEKARKQFQHLIQSNQLYQQCLKEIRQENLLKGLEIDDFTIKPVQRLPKYLLLLKDLLKHTSTDHPDYKNIVECFETIDKINDKNNNEMQVYLNQLKIQDLQLQFQDYIQICEPNRYFIFEDICQIYTKKIQKRIIIYCFNNLLLFIKISKQNAQRYLLHIPINIYSYVKDIKDSNVLQYSFLFTTRGDSIIIVNNDENTKQKLIEKLDEVIKAQKVQSEKKISQIQIRDDKLNQLQNVRVDVISTENKKIQNKPTTLYITLFEIDGVTTRTRIRFNQIFAVQQIIHKMDPNLKIPNFTKKIQSKNKNTIDERKLLIEQLFLRLFNSDKCQQCKEYQKQILETLNLDLQFFSPKAQRSQQSNSSIHQSSFSKISYLEQLQQEQQKILLQGINDETQIKIGADAFQQPYFIEITLLNGQIVTVGFKKNTIAWQIKKAIANFQQLKQFVDFRIFIVDSSNLCKVVDDNEKLSTLLDKNKQGFFSALKKFFSHENRFQYYFRKYYYLPWKYEEIDYLKDENRLKYLMLEVAFQSVNQVFPLLFKDYCFVAAIYCIATNQNIDRNILQKIIPNNIRKQQIEKVWLDYIAQTILQQQKVLQANQQNFQQKNQIVYQSNQNIAALLMVTCFQSNILYGMTLFFVECSKDTLTLASQKNINLKLNQYQYIGLNYDGFYFIKPENKMIIAKIDYDLISDLKSYPIEFVCKIKQQELRFKTQSSYELKQLILEYQYLRKFLNS